MRVVLDTNVLVSGIKTEQGASAAVLNHALSGAVQWCVTDLILSEYREVLSRPKFKFSKLELDRVFKALKLLQEIGIVIAVQPDFTLEVSPHEPDNRFLECADAAAADYLITGNKRHFPASWKRTKIVNARDFLEHRLRQTLES
jgi:putative PIN family toxin of toxin-antitoxin system